MGRRTILSGFLFAHLATVVVGCGWLAGLGDTPLPEVSNAPGSSVDATTGDGGTPAPLTVAPAYLRLWLTADRGVTCSAGRVTRWADQSGNGDDATPELGQLGPQCQITQAPHTINGVDVPYFSAPVSPDAASLYPIDETLDVNLAFLANSDYTIFAVERRWADYAASSSFQEQILGTVPPPPLELFPNPSCDVVRNQAVGMGYEYWNGSGSLVIDQTCNTLLGAAPAPPIPEPPPVAPAVDTACFDSTRGHALWVNGFPLASDNPPNTTPLAYAGGNAAGGGAIGRAFQRLSSPIDTRFRGDIAEVVVYNAGLEDADRTAIIRYLESHWGLLP